MLKKMYELLQILNIILFLFLVKYYINIFIGLVIFVTIGIIIENFRLLFAPVHLEKVRNLKSILFIPEHIRETLFSTNAEVFDSVRIDVNWISLYYLVFKIKEGIYFFTVFSPTPEAVIFWYFESIFDNDHTLFSFPEIFEVYFEKDMHSEMIFFPETDSSNLLKLHIDAVERYSRENATRLSEFNPETEHLKMVEQLRNSKGYFPLYEVVKLWFKVCLKVPK